MSLIDNLATLFVFLLAIFFLLGGMSTTRSKRASVDKRRAEIIAELKDSWETTPQIAEELLMLDKKKNEAWDSAIYGLLLYLGVIASFVVATLIA